MDNSLEYRSHRAVSLLLSHIIYIYIYHILRNKKINECAQNISPYIHVLSHINLIHALNSIF
jgi:hypothetical protein